MIYEHFQSLLFKNGSNRVLNIQNNIYKTSIVMTICMLFIIIYKQTRKIKTSKNFK